jgi:hypothetical protein
MIKKQFKYLKFIIKLESKRLNKKNSENKEKYLLAKKEGRQNNKVTQIKKNTWKKNRYLNGPLNKEDMLDIVAKLEKIDSNIFTKTKLDKWLEEIEIIDFFDKHLLDGGSYSVAVNGVQAYEDYKLERLSKIKLPLIAIVVSIFAFIVASIALFI